MSNGKPFQGGPGCPSYTAPVFGSLYIKDPSAPPDPIDGPVPASPYIIPLPAPTPCTCLSFDVWPNTGRVLRLVPPSQQAKGLGLSFKPKAEDNCCDGRFDVTTDLEIPCIPFTLEKSSAVITFKNTPSETAAAIEKFGIKQEDCKLTPELELTLPCIPAPSYEYMLKTYNKGEQDISYPKPKVGGDACSPTFTTTLDIPCPINVRSTPVTIQAVRSDNVPASQTINLALEPDATGCGVQLVPENNVIYLPNLSQQCPVSVSNKTVSVGDVRLSLAQTGCELRLSSSGTLNIPTIEEWIKEIKFVFRTESDTTKLVMVVKKGHNGRADTYEDVTTGIRVDHLVEDLSMVEPLGSFGDGSITINKRKALIMEGPSDTTTNKTKFCDIVTHTTCMDDRTE